SAEPVTAGAVADAKAGTVGVGASVAINVLTTDHTWAVVEDGAILVNGHDVAITATSTETVTTTVKAGAGGQDGIAPAVAVAVVLPDTKATLGTPGSALSANGNVTISATFTGVVHASGNADAAGSDVAVGAIIAVNVVLVHTAATTSRNITSAGAITITSTSTVDAGGEVHASAKGESQSGQSADTQADNSVNKNSNSGGMTGTLPSANDQASSANSQSSSQSGNSGGSVGGAAAAGGQSDTSVAGSVGINVALFDVQGSIGANSTITSTGVLGAHASAPIGLQNLALAAGGGTGGAVGIAIAVNVVFNHVDAFIGANTHATATGAVTVTATAGLTSLPVTGISRLDDVLTFLGIENSFSSVAASGAAGSGDYAV